MVSPTHNCVTANSKDDGSELSELDSCQFDEFSLGKRAHNDIEYLDDLDRKTHSKLALNTWAHSQKQ